MDIFKSPSSQDADELYKLYELSLSIGKSTDFRENCDTFLKRLLELKNLDYASVWIKGNYLSANPDTDRNYYLQYASSENYNENLVVTPYHPVIKRLQRQDLVQANSVHDDQFQYLVLEQPVQKGNIALFSLGQCGFLKLYAANNHEFEDAFFSRLTDIIDHFKISVERSLYFQKAFVESKEKQYIRQSLEEKDALYKNVVENLHEGVIITDLVNRIIFVNKKFEVISGYNFEEIKGELIYKLLVPELNRDHMKQKINLKKNENAQYELECLNKKDELWTGSFSSFPYINGNSALMGTITVVSDITQKKKDQESLENLAKFHSENPFPVFRVEGSGKISVCNEAARNIINQWESKPDQDHLPARVIQKIDKYKSRKKVQEINVNIGDKVFEFSFAYIEEKGYYNVYGREITEIHHTQEALRKNEEKFRLISENSRDLIALHKPDGTYEYLSPSVKDILGYDPEELIGTNPRDILFHEDQHKIVNADNPATREGIIYNNIVYRIKRKDGNYIWLETMTQPIWDDKGNIIRLQTTSRDITEKKNTEDKLITTSSRLTTLMENLQSGVLVIDENNRIRVTNKIFCDMFNLKTSPENLVGKDGAEHYKNISAFVSEPDNFYEDIRKILDKRQIVSGDQIYLNDGRILERDFVPIFTSGKYMGHLWQYNDITQRVKSARDLEESEARQRALLSAIPDLILRMDSDGNFLDVKPGIQSPVNNPDQLRGINIYKTAFPDAIKNRITQTIHDAIESGDMQYIEFKMPRDNEMRYYEERIVKSAKSEVICTVRDITERKLSEHALIEARKRAEESSKSKEAFLANMSHEIRTPMNAIVGMSHLLKKTRLNQEQREYLDAIQASSDNLLVIINDILDISKIEAGKLKIENIGFDVRHMIENLIRSVKYKADEKNITLHKEVDENIPQILIGDPYRLHQILINLVNNAIKFTGKGFVSIKCFLKQEMDENIYNIAFEVEDTGVGIDQDKIDTIFESFNQEDSSTSRKYGGTGLGLSITRKLVNMFGGTIHVVSKKDKGSVFYFNIDLPSGKKQDLPEDNKPDNKQINLKGIQILIAEDHQFNQLLVKSILKDYYIEPFIAKNGQEAIEMVKNHDFDLILMDIQMPDINGVEASQYIRKELNKDVPIIALTANALKGDEEKYLSGGMNDYISKPFDPEMLVNKINQWVKNQGKKPQVSKSAQGETQSNEKTKEKAEAPAFDHEVEEALFSTQRLMRSMGNDDRMLRQMLDSFTESSEEILESMHQAYKDNDMPRLGKLAHKLKPSIDMMGISLLKEEIRVLESLGKGQGKKKEITPVYQKINDIMHKVIAQVKSEKQE